MKHIDFDDFISQIKEYDVVMSSRGKEYEIESIAEGVVTVSNPTAVVNPRRCIRLEDLYQAYLALEATELTTSAVRRYVKTGAAEATALLRTIFGSREIMEALKTVLNNLPVDHKLEMLKQTTYPIGLSAESGLEGLTRMAYALGLGSLRKCSRMEVDELGDAIYESVIDRPQEFVKRLTLADLEMLKAFDMSDSTLYGNTPLPFLLEEIGVVISVRCDEEDDESYVMTVNKGVMEAVKPYIEDAIAAKKATKEPIMEQAFCGILNIYGAIETDKARDILITTLPKMDKTITEKSIRTFCKQSFLVRFCSDVDSDGRILNRISEFDASYVTDADPNITMSWPESAAKLLAFGSYPYLTPYTKEQKAYYNLLAERMGALEASHFYTVGFYDVQDCDAKNSLRVIKDAISKVSQSSKNSKKLTNKDLKIVSDAFNSFPRVFLKGHSPKEMVGFNR